MIAPYFDDFELRPEGPNAQEIILKWKENGSDEVFGAHQLSDGTLRTIFLVSLLLQPEEELPPLIIVDEPELGLHPYAVNIIASLLKKASHHAQVLVSTQSSSFLDNFEPIDVIVADREEMGSVSPDQTPRPSNLGLRNIASARSGRRTSLAGVRTVGNAFTHSSPELIDDGPQTAPGKRIIDLIADYESSKSVAGPQIAQRIGLDAIRGKCPHFNSWLSRLESLGS